MQATSGVRLDVTKNFSIDLSGGSRFDIPLERSRPVAQLGGALRGDTVSITGRVEYATPDEFSGVVGMEVKW